MKTADEDETGNLHSEVSELRRDVRKLARALLGLTVQVEGLATWEQRQKGASAHPQAASDGTVEWRGEEPGEVHQVGAEATGGSSPSGHREELHEVHQDDGPTTYYRRENDGERARRQKQQEARRLKKATTSTPRRRKR